MRGLGGQGDGHLQQPIGPAAETSRVLSVSEARVGSVDMDDASLADEEDVEG